MADDFRGMVDAFMDLMEGNRSEGDISRPKIGIFWWDSVRGCFGVDYEYADSAAFFASSHFNQNVKCAKSGHGQQWKKLRLRGKLPKEYALVHFSMVPRGRVFQLEDGTFVVCHGHWLDEHPEAKADIISEFDLPEDKTMFQYDTHWDIGNTWNDELA